MQPGHMSLLCVEIIQEMIIGHFWHLLFQNSIHIQSHCITAIWSYATKPNLISIPSMAVDYIYN